NHLESSFSIQKTDSSPLAQFYFADEELNLVAAELDSFDGRKDPERCTALVNRLRSCQDKVLNVIQAIMEEAIPGQRANRDFRVKFPDDVLQENLAGQLWFGAECLAAGSSIMNREIESASMRPLARALTKNLDSLRTLLREQCLRNINSFTERIKESLMIFDKLFAEFELRALTTGLLNQDLIDDCDPALMFTIPRLAIISGLLVYPEGPLNPDLEPSKEPVYTPSYSQSDQALQTDHGFEDGVEQTESSGLDNLDNLQDSVLINPSSCDSPVTPVADPLLISSGLLHSINGLPSQDYSPTDTIINSFEVEPEEALNSNLNKSDSRDSGLHSENVSTSDTVISSDLTLVSPSDTSTAMTFTTESNPEQRTPTSSTSFFRESSSCVDSTDENHHFCREIVDEVVETVCLLSERVINTPSYSRQHSWQYNLNLEIPRISVSDLIQQQDSESSSSNETDKETCDENSEEVFHESHDCTQGSSSRCDNTSSASVSDSGSCDNTHSSSVSGSASNTVKPDKISGKNQKCKCYTSSCACDKSEREHGTVSSDIAEASCSHGNSSNSATGLTHDIVNQKRSSKVDKQLQTAQKVPFERIYCKTGSQYGDSSSSKTKSSDIQSDIPQIQKQQYAESNLSSSVSSCHSNSYEGEWEQESGGTSETSSYNSDCNDDEEIALAISAAELASRNEARSRFRSSSDLIHRLFVCVSGVADQLQTNYAGDLRNILKSVFDIHSSEPYYPSDTRDKSSLINISAAHWRSREGERRSRNQRSHRSRTRINKDILWQMFIQLRTIASLRTDQTSEIQSTGNVTDSLSDHLKLEFKY
ncbi:hypothetical protein KUTeg_005795, partial [Tegillarca granosa]